MTRRRRNRWGIALATAVLLASCSATGSDPDGEEATAEAPTTSTPRGELPETPAELAAYYEQDVVWEECGNLECTDITVPMDYEDPQGEHIELAVQRRPADEDAIGSLLVNPGGPGGSGTDLVESVGMLFSEDLLAGYDVVGFDPRGVGSSTAVECVTDAELDEVRATDYDTSSAEGIAELRQAGEALAAACQENTGELLGHVDTASAARDLDVLRHVLGEPELDYLGFSYGTQLGAVYAELFPAQVGRLVLDGGLDPSLSTTEMVRGQAAGFERALRAYAADCLAGSGCPLTGDVDTAVGQVQDLLTLAGHTPLATGTERELTAPLMFSGLIMPLYDDAYWMLLTSALSAAMADNDGSQLLMLADLSAERQPDGTYRTNSTEANIAINCLDHPVEGDLEDWHAEAEVLEEISPTFGPALAYGDATCAAWPHEPSTGPTAVTAAGAAPIVVVGTTGDPATPYEWSEQLADQLEPGVLVTYEGEGHTAYGRAGDCLTQAVDDYLLEGTVPEDGLRC